MIWEKVFASIGILTVVCILLNLLSVTYKFLRPSRLHKFLHDGEQTYAFITGATDGVGRSMAYELAKNGFNLVLHGRNNEKLQSITEDLHKQYPDIQTRQYMCDASKDLLEPSRMSALYKAVEGIHLSILINNVGGMGCLPPSCLFQAYESYTGEQIDTVLNVNLRFMAQLTRILIPLLDHTASKTTAGKKRQPSLIVNVASVGARGSPYLTVYAGAKAFVASFSNSLSMEMQMDGKDINVQALIVGETRSGSYNVKEGMMVPHSNSLARSALKMVGSDRETFVSGCLPHWIAKISVQIMPVYVSNMLFMSTIKKLKADHEKRIASITG
ncbi:testosterone 17-beta-dehydrogenase 3 [Nannizzia gypsea CBS 118893]|uniref:Testosterone 17-beta-dehydrogenase 3 n=1 Tax=Arthroderma gypseum (strain ATCC MYA-4604 / CBS 118893) TaxID=535722 RepID=E4UNU1_ARTGP|nr:testosterone 17-beta-dehydrogenase 3 [Nannizzia gypsea CBS 118893]EFQ99694.1 testosterone 17-beta-dehydrogenase 3 [Nannizzia gypsea CBS 118893]